MDLQNLGHTACRPQWRQLDCLTEQQLQSAAHKRIRMSLGRFMNWLKLRSWTQGAAQPCILPEVPCCMCRPQHCVGERHALGCWLGVADGLLGSVELVTRRARGGSVRVQDGVADEALRLQPGRGESTLQPHTHDALEGAALGCTGTCRALPGHLLKREGLPHAGRGLSYCTGAQGTVATATLRLCCMGTHRA